MSKKHLLFSMIFAVMILVSSCRVGNEGSTGTRMGGIHHSPIREILSYLPKQWIDQHPAEFMGPTIYYLDFESMSRDRNLPNVSSADNRSVKLPLLTGLSTQGLSFTPENIDPIAGSSFTSWGWDVADVTQVLYVPNRQVSIIRGSFSETDISAALTSRNYSSTHFDKFQLFVDPTNAQWFAVTSNLILIAPSRNEIDAVIEQKQNSASRVDEASYLHTLISRSQSPHGFILVASGDLTSGKEPFGHFPSVSDETTISCTYKFDWDFLTIQFRSTNEHTQIEIIYSFSSEQDAIANLQVIRDALTKTPSLRYPSLSWADLIDLNSIKIDKNLVIAAATTDGKTFLGTSINSRDFYGFLPTRKLDPNCFLDAASP